MHLKVTQTTQDGFIGEQRTRDARGKVQWLQTVKRPKAASSQVPRVFTNVTHRKEAALRARRQRAELAHATRVSMMGELAASLAHELTQPLTAILSNAQAALRFISGKPPDLEEVREILKEIVQDNSRATEIIRRVRTLVKKEEIDFAAADVRSIIDDALTLVHGDAVSHHVQISVKADAGLPPAHGDRVQLQQVILNLLLNAFEALKDRQPGDRHVVVRAEYEDARMLKVTVSDSGVGLSGDALDKIFRPFYTTRREGLGMGLSICRSIIKAHGGELWAENNPEGGANFCFTVPVEK